MVLRLILTVLLLFSAGRGFTAPLWIDVRTQAEYQADHIEGDINIPLAVIGDSAATLVTDKSAQIILYCRSGKRAGVALAELKALGYTNVKNAGGINDARQVRGLAAP